MKASSFFCTLLAASTVLCATAVAATSDDFVTSVLPTDGTLMQGAVVKVLPSDKFMEMQKAVLERFSKLPADKQKAISDAAVDLTLAEYTPDLWSDKKDYEAYAAAWKEARIVPVSGVALALAPVGDKDNKQYHVVSATRINEQETMPITLGSLVYDANKHTWISNNGEMEAKPFERGANYLLGAQTGTEWSLTKQDSLSTLREQVTVTKTTDGKAIFIYYSLTELATSSNTPIANHGYVIMLPITSTSANATKPGQK